MRASKHYTEEERKHYYEKFLKENKSQAAFARQYDINESTFHGWLLRYGYRLNRERSNPYTDSNTSRDLNNLVTVTQDEYQELQKIKFKYLTICSIMNLE